MKNKNFIIFCLLYLLFNISVNIVHPITTDYVNELNLPSFYFGIFFSMMALGQLFGSIFWGVISDKIGRRIPIIIGLCGYALAQLGFGFINEIPFVIIIFRLLSGFFSSAPVTLFISSTLDRSTAENKDKSLSFIVGINILGASLGYEIGGSIYTYLGFTSQQVFLFQSVFCLLVALLIALLFGKESKEAYTKETKKFSLSSFKGISFIPVIFLLGVVTMTIGQICISKYIDVIVIDEGYSAATLGHYVLITGLFSCLCNFTIIPLIKKYSKAKNELLITIFVLVSGGLVFITFNVPCSLLVMLYTTHVVYSVLKSLITPLEQSYLSKFSSKNGTLMGARQSLISLANVIGPLLGSAIYTTGSVLIMNISGAIILSSLIFYGLTFLFVYLKNK